MDEDELRTLLKPINCAEQSLEEFEEARRIYPIIEYKWDDNYGLYVIELLDSKTNNLIKTEYAFDEKELQYSLDYLKKIYNAEAINLD